MRYIAVIRPFIICVLLSVVYLANSNGQENFAATVGKPTNCEDALNMLDLSVTKARLVPESRLIVIGRRGDREKSSSLVASRMGWVERYLTEVRKVPFVIGEGKKAVGLARFELYVQGSLEAIIYLEENAGSPCKTPIG